MCSQVLFAHAIYHTSKHFCARVGACTCDHTPLLKRPVEATEIMKKICWSLLTAKVANIFNKKILFCSLKTYVNSILQTGQ